MLAVGLLQATAYFIALQSNGPEGGMASGSIDVNCYAQSARALVEGHPFCHSPGEPPSTGTTSVAYPVLLAAPMACGATGTRIYAAVFGWSVVLYFVFLAAWGAVIATCLPAGVGRFAAAALVSLSGHCAFTAFMGSDQTLWMAVSALFALALVRGGVGFLSILAVAAPWVRPEGMMVVVSLGVFGVLARRRGWVLAAGLGVLSSLGVFALNHAVAGQFQFTSVSGKGHFHELPFPLAVRTTAEDALEIVTSFLCGVPVPLRRMFHVPSPVAGVFFWIGAMGLLRSAGVRRLLRCRLAPFAGAMLLGFASVASSSYAGIDFDRYLAWMVPPVLILAGCGLARAVRWIPVGVWRRFFIVLTIVAALFSTGAMVSMMGRMRDYSDFLHGGARRARRLLPPGAAVGSRDLVFAYDLPGHPYRNITGIYSPEYGVERSYETAFEQLKYRPDLRFPYWATLELRDRSSPDELVDLVRRVMGRPLDATDPLCPVRIAEWAAYDRAIRPPEVPRLGPVARLDVCYAPDERLTKRTVERPEFLNFTGFPTVARGEGGQTMFDCGRFVTTAESFTLPAEPGRDAVLVLRTTGSVRFLWGTSYTGRDYPGAREIELEVDGRTAARVRVELEPDVFTDCRLSVPGRFIMTRAPRFTVRGEFPSFGYWLYQ